jgi:ribonuclease BN (tRNA processing enzyme)
VHNPACNGHCLRGIRIESAAGCLAYTGDTGVTPGLPPLAADADLLLAEATLPTTDHGPHGHLSAVDAARVAQEADPDWLLARRDEAVRAFAGAVHLAQPGKTFQVG